MKSIKILGVKFRIKFQPLKEFPDETAGLSSITAREIILPNDVEEDLFKELFYHEVCHMILEISGLAEVVGPKMEEAICNVMGIAMGDLKH